MLYARAVFSLLLLAHGASALQIGAAPLRTAAVTAVRSPSARAAEAPLPCTLPDAQGSVLMNDVSVSGATLRSMDLADATGTRVRSAGFLGDGRAIVVFLRHLG